MTAFAPISPRRSACASAPSTPRSRRCARRWRRRTTRTTRHTGRSSRGLSRPPAPSSSTPSGVCSAATLSCRRTPTSPCRCGCCMRGRWTPGDTSPFMVLVSPTKRCGKTSVLILLFFLTPKSELASNITAAALFRYIEAIRPTLLIDEADTFVKNNEELRGILDSGHTTVAAQIIRNVEVNGEHKPRRFSTWAAKAIATIRKLADTLEDRSVIVTLQRKPRDARVERLRRRDTEEFKILRSQAARWAADNFDKLVDPDPAVPGVLNDRAADNWRPLLAIADLA